MKAKFLAALIAGIGLPGGAAMAEAPGGAIVAGPASAVESDERRRVPGEVVVGYSNSSTGELRAAARRDADVSTAERAPSLPGVALLETVGDVSVSEAITELEDSPGVAYAEPNFRREFHAIPDDEFFGRLWGMQNLGQPVPPPDGPTGTVGADIGAPQAWETETGSDDVVVAVMDSGYDFDHVDLDGNFWRNPGETGAGRQANGVDDDGNGFVDDWRGWDFGVGDNDPSAEPFIAGGNDVGWHGTHVAGTVGAEGDNEAGIAGVAWDISILPIRIADDTTSFRSAESIAYAGKMGADIANGSYGSGGVAQAEAEALAASPETLFVFSAGNNGNNNDASAQYPCSHTSANVICVAATDNNDARPSFSNYGASSVDLGAPGVSILSTFPTYSAGNTSTYFYSSGTSMASPMVAGAAGVLKSAAPGARPADLKAALLDGAQAVPSLNGVTVTGGRLDLEHSLELLDTTPPQTRLTAPPRGTVTTRKRELRISFRFRANEPASFACKLDRNRWAPCTSPHRRTVKATKRAKAHTFLVRATDALGNLDRSPARAAFRVKRKR